MASTKAISVLGALQAGQVVFGTLLITVLLKANGYGEEINVVWNQRAVWIREHGWTLIALPVLWLGLCLWLGAEKGKLVLAIGAIIVLGLFSLYFDSVFNMFYRPILLLK